MGTGIGTIHQALIRVRTSEDGSEGQDGGERSGEKGGYEGVFMRATQQGFC